MRNKNPRLESLPPPLASWPAATVTCPPPHPQVGRRLLSSHSVTFSTMKWLLLLLGLLVISGNKKHFYSFKIFADFLLLYKTSLSSIHPQMLFVYKTLFSIKNFSSFFWCTRRSLASFIPGCCLCKKHFFSSRSSRFFVVVQVVPELHTSPRCFLC
jgi:hypothetical protein